MPSPFLEGTHYQFAWDSTSLGWLKECPRKYYYAMICGYVRRGEQVHLKFGILYHSALEHYDKYVASGMDPEDAVLTVVLETLRATWADGAPWDSQHPNKTRETLVRSVIWYLDQFGVKDPCKTIILANGKPAVELSFKMEIEEKAPNGENYLLCGHFDRAITFEGDPYGMDRKTTASTISAEYFKQYSPDNQMTLYVTAMDVVYHTPIKGMIIDAAQIAVGFTAFQRGITMRSPGQTTEWLKDTGEHLELAKRFAERNYWPMNDKSCHKYGGCPFRGVCSKDPVVRDQFLVSDFEVKKWNPLEER